jgi:hypothetical protein
VPATYACGVYLIRPPALVVYRFKYLVLWDPALYTTGTNLRPRPSSGPCRAVQIKGKGEMETYWVGAGETLSADLVFKKSRSFVYKWIEEAGSFTCQ